MAITRKSLADTYAQNDAIIEAAQTAKRDATLAYRGQLDQQGMDKDNIKAEVEGFKLAYRRKVAVTKKGVDAVEYRDAIADEIFLEITSPAPRATRSASAVPNHSSDLRNMVPDHDADGVIIEDDEITGHGAGGAEDAAAVATVAAPSSAQPIQAETPNDDRSCVSVPGGLANGLQQQATRKGEPARPLPATNSPEGASEAVGGFLVSATPLSRGATRGDEGDQTSQPVNVGGSPDATAGETATNPIPQPVEGTTPTSAADGDRGGQVPPPSQPAPVVPSTYPEPGIVVMERCPPEGVVEHPFARCWPVNPVDVTDGVHKPVVKLGKFILDGRGRYFAAREAGIEYPVVQYEGTDPLGDMIRWNLASRNPSEKQRRVIAEKLAKIEPSRADEVMQLFGLHLEAAE